MYGGLFSFLLKDSGMTGVSHSICYGEHKEPFTVGGMAATIRYYEPYLHSKVPFGRMEEIENALGLKKCKCEYCSKISEIEEKGDQLAVAGKHFLLTRTKELNDLESKGVFEVLSEIEQDVKNAEKNDPIGAYSSFYEKFSIWSDILRS